MSKSAIPHLKKYSIIKKKYEDDIDLKDVVNLEEMCDIIEVPEGHRIVAYREVCLSGFEFKGQRMLEHNMTIWLPSGNIYYYKNNLTQVNYESGMKKDSRSTDLEKEYSEDSLGIMKIKHYNDFWRRGRHGKTLKKLADRLVNWSVKKYRFERSIFYLVENFRAIPFLSNCKGLAQYNTPETVLRGVFFSKNSYTYSPEDEDSPSMSMLENQAKYVCCAPICAKGEIIAILYADSTRETAKVHNKFLIHICLQISPIVASLLVPKLKEVDLEPNSEKENV